MQKKENIVSDKPVISVIIPLYNGADRIEKCLKELDKQTISEYFDVLLVDDASTDNSVEVVYTCIHNLNHPDRFKIIRCKENGRAGTARNIGVKVSNASYIVFVDQDDYPDRDMLKILYELTENETIDCTACDMVDRNGKEYHRVEGGHYKELSDNERIHFMSNFGYTFATLIRRKILIDNNHFFPEKVMFEDTLYNFGLLSIINSINTTDQILYYRSADPNSQTAKFTLKKLSDRVAATNYYLEEYKNSSRFDNFLPLIKEFAFYFIYLSCTWWMMITPELNNIDFFNYCYGQGKQLRVKWRNIYKTQRQFSVSTVIILNIVFIFPTLFPLLSRILPSLRAAKKRVMQ